MFWSRKSSDVLGEIRQAKIEAEAAEVLLGTRPDPFARPLPIEDENEYESLEVASFE